ncbi:hypothetical protein HNQ82_001661 [Anoxybacillus tengchongensis]|uniref:Uncharacterized protein n=1 Tax=Anoxybacillus tengchongensis TaxID=576944 RepID=A0A7W9YTE1_9BACL|nr:hypothetical protein [Anoxybacillus tengchongensis]
MNARVKNVLINLIVIGSVVVALTSGIKVNF